MKRKLLCVLAVAFVCTPIGGLVSTAFGKAGLPAVAMRWDAPCWFSPERLLMLGAVLAVLTLLHYRGRERRKREL